MSGDIRLDRAFLAGWLAGVLGKPAADNPHGRFEAAAAWALGWHRAQGPVPLEVLEQAVVAGLPDAWLEPLELAA